MHVPEHTGAEVLSVIRGLRLSGEISDAIALQSLADYAGMPLRRHPAVQFIPRTWELRYAMTCYDALYAALAEALECPVVTCDEKLRVGGHRAEVIIVGAREA